MQPVALWLPALSKGSAVGAKSVTSTRAGCFGAVGQRAFSLYRAVHLPNFKQCSVTHCISRGLCRAVLWVVSSTLSGFNSAVCCSSLLKVIKNSIERNKLFICLISSVHESVTGNLIRCAKAERYLSHSLAELWTLHSNQCFSLFVLLYLFLNHSPQLCPCISP